LLRDELKVIQAEATIIKGVKRKAEGLVAPIELKNNDLTAKIVLKREELQTRRDDRFVDYLCIFMTYVYERMYAYIYLSLDGK
jgi:hypothetical protein